MFADIRSCSRVVWLAPSASTVMTSSSSRLTTSTAPRCCFIESRTGMEDIADSSSIHANAVTDAGSGREDFAQAAIGRCRDVHVEQGVRALIRVCAVLLERPHQQRHAHADDVIPLTVCLDLVGGAIRIDDDIAGGVDAVLDLHLLDAFDQLFRRNVAAAPPKG